MTKLRTRFGQTAPVELGDEAFTATDQYLGSMCFFRRGHLIGGYANVPTGQDAKALSTALAGHLPK